MVNSFMAYLVSSRAFLPAQKAKTGCSKKSKTRRLSGRNLQKIQIRSGKIFESIASIKKHGTVFRDHRVIEGGMISQDCKAIHRLKQVGCHLNGFEGLTSDDYWQNYRIAAVD